MQIALNLEPAVQKPAVPSHMNVFGTGISVHCFGRGFPWKKRHYGNWGEGARLLKPYLDDYWIERAVVPDFRGMNALVSGISAQETVKMDLAGRLMRTAQPIDCIPLKQNCSVFAISADCHTVIIVDTAKRCGKVLHCSRDALQPIKRDGSRRRGRESIIDEAMTRLMPTSVEDMRAMILCGIGARSYENRHDYDKTGFHKAVVEHFVKECGRGIVVGPFEEGRLNIPEIIRVQLARWGVGRQHPEHVVWDGIDTYANAKFYSRRREADGCNGILIDTRHAFKITAD